MERTLRQVGEDEVDASQEFISRVSPLARALSGLRAGDGFEFRSKT